MYWLFLLYASDVSHVTAADDEEIVVNVKDDDDDEEIVVNVEDEDDEEIVVNVEDDDDDDNITIDFGAMEPDLSNKHEFNARIKNQETAAKPGDSIDGKLLVEKDANGGVLKYYFSSYTASKKEPVKRNISIPGVFVADKYGNQYPVFTPKDTVAFPEKKYKFLKIKDTKNKTKYIVISPDIPPHSSTDSSLEHTKLLTLKTQKGEDITIIAPKDQSIIKRMKKMQPISNDNIETIKDALISNYYLIMQNLFSRTKRYFLPDLDSCRVTAKISKQDKILRATVTKIPTCPILKK